MKQLIPALFAVGAVMALIGAAVFITGWVYAPYIYTIGAGFVALAQVSFLQFWRIFFPRKSCWFLSLMPIFSFFSNHFNACRIF